MNWSRSSRALVATLLLLVATVGVAAAVSVDSQGVPNDAAVGEEVTATYTFTDLYTDFESWTLRGETNMTGVTWTVQHNDQAGNQVRQNSYDGASFDESVDIEEDTAEVVVTVRGTVPEVENYTYEPREEFLLAEYTLVREGGSNQELAADRVHHYTNESEEARGAIDSARAAIDEAGGDEQAERTLGNAIDAYEGEQFDLAIDLANEAEEQAQQRQSARSRNQLLLYGGVGLLVLLLLGGGIYYWRSRQDDYDKLR